MASKVSQATKVKRRGRNRQDEYSTAYGDLKESTKEAKKAKGKRGLNGIFNEIEYEDALGALKNYYLNKEVRKTPNSWENDCDGLYLHYRRELIWYHIRCGYSKALIEQQLSETFGIALCTAKNWYKDALESAITDPENGKRETKQIILEQNNIILQQCLSRGDYKNALTALNQMAKMVGIYEPEQIQVAETIKFKFGE
jgi:hypothetical protein